MERASFRWHGTTCTVKTPWNTHPTAVSPLKPSHSPLSIWVCFPRLHSSFSRLSPLLEQRQGSKDHRLGDLKRDVDLRLTIDNVGIDFDILVTTVLIKCSNTVHALTEQLVAKLPSRDEQSMGLYGDLLKKVTVADMLIAPECDGFDFVARAPV